MELVGKLFGFCAKAYQKSVYKDLRKYGLRYEDIMIVEHPDVQFALRNITKAEKVARDRRLTRAIMLNLRHEYLPKEVQAVQTTETWYLKDLMETSRKLREEREVLNNF
jgi:ubiquinol-cytochrome c reductase subunit 7